MGTPPLVSIVTIARDGAASIERCIRSQLRQGYPHLELLVRDLDSSDGTPAALERYRGRIRLASGTDPGSAYRRSVECCRGEIVGFCDHDGELEPEAVRHAVAALEARPELAAVYSDQVLTDGLGQPKGSRRSAPWDFERVYCSETLPPLCGAFFRRSALESAFRAFPELPPEAVPYALWSFVGSRGPVLRIDQILGRTRSCAPDWAATSADLPAPPAGIAEIIDRLATLPDACEQARALHAQARGNAHLSAAARLFLVRSEHVGGSEQLARALEWAPNRRHFASLGLRCLVWSLRRDRSDALSAWLDACDALGVEPATVDYVRALAAFEQGRLDLASAAERRLVRASDLSVLLGELGGLLDDLLQLGRAVEAEYALDVLRRLGPAVPRLSYGLAATLANQSRHREALGFIESHLATEPRDGQAMAVRDLIQLRICADESSLRRTLASGQGERRNPSVSEAAPFVHAIWRALAQPDVAGQLSPAARAPLRHLSETFRPTALALGFQDLGTRLERLAARLAEPAAASPAGPAGGLPTESRP